VGFYKAVAGEIKISRGEIQPYPGLAAVRFIRMPRRELPPRGWEACFWLALSTHVWPTFAMNKATDRFLRDPGCCGPMNPQDTCWSVSCLTCESPAIGPQPSVGKRSELPAADSDEAMYRFLFGLQCEHVQQLWAPA